MFGKTLSWNYHLHIMQDSVQVYSYVKITLMFQVKRLSVIYL